MMTKNNIAKGIILLFVTATMSCSPENKKAENNATVVSQENFKTTTIPIEGMTCMSCVSRVKKTISSLEGVKEVEVNLEKRNANVSYDAQKISTDSMINVINELGYKAGTPQ